MANITPYSQTFTSGLTNGLMGIFIDTYGGSSLCQCCDFYDISLSINTHVLCIAFHKKQLMTLNKEDQICILLQVASRKHMRHFLLIVFSISWTCAPQKDYLADFNATCIAYIIQSHQCTHGLHKFNFKRCSTNQKLLMILMILKATQVCKNNQNHNKI